MVGVPGTAFHQSKYQDKLSFPATYVYFDITFLESAQVTQDLMHILVQICTDVTFVKEATSCELCHAHLQNKQTGIDKGSKL